MKTVHFLGILSVLSCCVLTTSLPVQAMGQKQDNPTVNKPANQPVKPTSLEGIRGGKLLRQYENRNPEADAQAALDKKDMRLLGFAGRATTVPGVAAADSQAAMDACGVRLMTGFGDVIKSPQELQARHAAHKYAIGYNAIVLKACFKKD